jgi:hypothetical protein
MWGLVGRAPCGIVNDGCTCSGSPVRALGVHAPGRPAWGAWLAMGHGYSWSARVARMPPVDGREGSVTEGQISAAVTAKPIMVTERHLRRLVPENWIRMKRRRAAHPGSVIGGTLGTVVRCLCFRHECPARCEAGSSADSAYRCCWKQCHTTGSDGN